MALEINPAQTAVVLIDLQNGIVSQSLAPRSGAEVVTKAVELARACANAGGIVVPVHVTFSPGGVDRPPQNVDSPMAIPAGGPPLGWSDLVPDVAQLPAAFRIIKRQWGAFFGTELDLQLRRRGITTIVLGGIATNFGVESTAREGWQHNYAIVIAEDACASATAEHHRFAVEKILPRIARVRSSAEILRSLGR